MAVTPAPENQLYMRWVFDLLSGGAPTDVAEFGLWGNRRHFTGNSVDWPADLQQAAESLISGWTTTMGGAKSLFSVAVKLNHIDVYHIDETGHATAKGSAGATGSDAWQGTAANGLPWECALVVSTSGFDPGGFDPQARHKRGRFYLPPLGVETLNGDGTLAGTPQTTLKVFMKSFLNDVQGTEMGTDGGALNTDYINLVVYSQWLDKIRRTQGVNTDLTHFRIGRVIDSQRRRRNKLTENYVDDTVSHA